MYRLYKRLFKGLIELDRQIDKFRLLQLAYQGANQSLNMEKAPSVFYDGRKLP